jgi:S1-C subfamily serine protease
VRNPYRKSILSDVTRWSFPPGLQPTQAEVTFDLQAALESVVALRAEVPDDAFTAQILGTDRTGNGVVIREDGLVLTIGYLVTEASSVWITKPMGPSSRATRSPTISRPASASSCRSVASMRRS